MSVAEALTCTYCVHVHVIQPVYHLRNAMASPLLVPTERAPHTAGTWMWIRSESGIKDATALATLPAGYA